MNQQRFEIFWADIAVRDLERIVAFVEQDAPSAAGRILEEIAGRARTLESLPLRGRVVPELARFEITTYRELVIPPYRLMYRVDADRVLVVGVFDGRRNLKTSCSRESLSRIRSTAPLALSHPSRPGPAPCIY